MALLRASKPARMNQVAVVVSRQSCNLNEVSWQWTVLAPHPPRPTRMDHPPPSHSAARPGNGRYVCVSAKKDVTVTFNFTSSPSARSFSEELTRARVQIYGPQHDSDSDIATRSNKVE